jgi:hypothetical protein
MAIGVRAALTTEPGIHFKTPFDGHPDAQRGCGSRP